ncbi:MAG: hypothetical protein GY874_23170 [Desulfobacteraceae bacterium]|nr:hypothetical protein [Desulfobacteraceae bacterium]
MTKKKFLENRLKAGRFWAYRAGSQIIVEIANVLELNIKIQSKVRIGLSPKDDRDAGIRLCRIGLLPEQRVLDFFAKASDSITKSRSQIHLHVIIELIQQILEKIHSAARLAAPANLLSVAMHYKLRPALRAAKIRPIGLHGTFHLTFIPCVFGEMGNLSDRLRGLEAVFKIFLHTFILVKFAYFQHGHTN